MVLYLYHFGLWIKGEEAVEAEEGCHSLINRV